MAGSKRSGTPASAGHLAAMAAVRTSSTPLARRRDRQSSPPAPVPFSKPRRRNVVRVHDHHVGLRHIAQHLVHRDRPAPGRGAAASSADSPSEGFLPRPSIPCRVICGFLFAGALQAIFPHLRYHRPLSPTAKTVTAIRETRRSGAQKGPEPGPRGSDRATRGSARPRGQQVEAFRMDRERPASFTADLANWNRPCAPNFWRALATGSIRDSFGSSLTGANSSPRIAKSATSTSAPGTSAASAVDQSGGPISPPARPAPPGASSTARLRASAQTAPLHHPGPISWRPPQRRQPAPPRKQRPRRRTHRPVFRSATSANDLALRAAHSSSLRRRSARFAFCPEGPWSRS